MKDNETVVSLFVVVFFFKGKILGAILDSKGTLFTNNY